MDTAGEAMGGIPPELIEATVAKGRAKGMPAVAATMRRMLEDAPLPEDSRERILDRLVHKLSNMDVEAFAALGRGLGEYPSMLERLGREVTVPVTVIVGANDVGLRPAAENLHHAIPKSELVVIPDAAHSPQDENPSAWLAAVRAHLARA